jgi:NAD(P)-dependent dehydrogenase (short-subunit alcohol dehydrogenase family)
MGRRENRLDILVNNAGITWGAPLESFPDSGWDKVLALNVKTPFFLARALLKELKAGATADEPARVINMGSIEGLRVSRLPNCSYSASKAALHHLTQTLANELGERHITVNAIAPGPFETRMMAAAPLGLSETLAARARLKRIGRPDDIAGAAVYLASRAGAYVTGAILPVDGGLAVA